jgi:hypothetical protein
MSVTFKCNRSGQTVTFTYEHDIKSMREHPDYTEVFPEEEQSFSKEEQPRRGRPRKVVEDIDTDSI